jgi:hypothetical protein
MTMSVLHDEDPIAEEACARLRRGLGRSRLLAAEARRKLAELTSETVYPGPAGLILDDATAHQHDIAAELPSPSGA